MSGKKFYFNENIFKPKKNPVYATGVLKMNVRGFGFVIQEDGEDIFVDGENLNGALHGDTVKVKIFFEFRQHPEGEVVEIVEPSNNLIVGTVTKFGKKFAVKPDDERIDGKIILTKLSAQPELKSKVIVQITERNPLRGKLVETLGKISEPGVDILAIIRSHGVDEKFPDEVKADALKVAVAPDEEEISKRIDRRNLKIVTIDGEDAKDLDDGVFAEKIPGGFRLGVYIADVSYYVRPGSPLDREAFERGTSIYPVDRVVPMLPEELSNGICSLNAGEDRFAMACEMKLDATGKVIEHEIFPTVIKVFRRLSYNQVNKFFSGETGELQDCAENLNTLLQISELRKKIREGRGSIDFDLPEIKITLDENGKPVEIQKIFSGIAQGVIEECMLAANETVAEHTVSKKIPAVYRVHELPTDEKIDTLNVLLARFGMHLAKSGERKVKPGDFQKILAKVKGLPAEKIISSFALRTMQQARYSTENTGHFGLAAKFYTHFTSPIRRYPDLIVHRMLRASFETPEKISRLAKKLDDIAKQSSDRERRAVDIERETTDLKAVEFMKKFVGQKFDAVISGVTSFGFFAELDNGVDGLVRVASLTDDFYNFVESEFALIGRRTGKSFRIGDGVRVRLIEANVKLKQLTFELVEGVTAENLIAHIDR